MTTTAACPTHRSLHPGERPATMGGRAAPGRGSPLTPARRLVTMAGRVPGSGHLLLGHDDNVVNVSCPRQGAPGLTLGSGGRSMRERRIVGTSATARHKVSSRSWSLAGWAGGGGRGGGTVGAGAQKGGAALGGAGGGGGAARLRRGGGGRPRARPPRGGGAPPRRSGPRRRAGRLLHLLRGRPAAADLDR